MAKRNIDLKHLDIRDKNSNPIENVSDLLKAQLEATCDCGIDCCKGELVLKDKVTNQPVRLSVSDGELSVGQSGVGGVSYKVYKALISQEEANPPTVVVLENTLGGDISWIRLLSGRYNGVLANAFPANKTFIIYDGIRPTTDSLSAIKYFYVNRIDNGTIELSSGVLDNPTDNILNSYPIEIQVYP